MLPGGIGLVELQDFNGLASRELARALAAMLGRDLRGLILDLRYNRGGVLDEARNVADLFLPAGELVVTTDYRVEKPDRLYTTRPALVPSDVPMVVLMNRFSASASEIVAGALSDHGRAIVAGERSFGKGAVQNVRPVIGMRDDAFEDSNENGIYDTWERLVSDRNGNGEFDFAPRVRMTVGRYLLPSGRSIHRELDADRNVISEGGIVPDIEVQEESVEAWRRQEQRRVYGTLAPRRYVNERWDEHAELFRRLALCDEKDPSLYPDFDALYKGLETVLSEDDVRMIVRLELRRHVQDERGGAFPFGDYQEDAQVQAAVASLLQQLGRQAQDFPEYRATFDQLEQGHALLAARGPDREEVDKRKKELASALAGDGDVDRATLEGILDILSSLE
jgi:hypothetical protein